MWRTYFVDEEKAGEPCFSEFTSKQARLPGIWAACEENSVQTSSKGDLNKDIDYESEKTGSLKYKQHFDPPIKT